MKTAIIIITISMVMMTGALYAGTTEQPPPIPSEEQPEVLTRGPVNEAFAELVNLEDQTGLEAPTEPPANIEEVPPAERPAGDQFVWIPGYWAWDSERDGYIWVSGCWRGTPPGTYWVPGYWAKTAEGWQWVPGFWMTDSNKELEYLPAPPPLTDVEPPGSAPSPDKIWVPPCWYWHRGEYKGEYIRRPGYWIAARANWVWVPSHYVRTPRGYVFVSGYWDYPLHRRGVLFAPVYFPRRIYKRPGFSYSLSIVVDIDNLEFALFACPRYSHYYFGDYYDGIYIDIGIFPWFEWEQRHTWYDPIYVHARWRHRKDKKRWEKNERLEYGRRRADKALRPPRTYHEMASRVRRMPESQRRNFEIAEPMSRVVERKTRTFKFKHIKPEDRQQISRHSHDVHRFTGDRNRWETQGAGRKAGHPFIERVPSAERKERTLPEERRGPEMKPSKRMESGTAERVHHGEAPGRGRATTSPERQRPTRVSPFEAERYQSDRVKVPTPPVVGKKRSRFLRKGPPSWPAEEQKTEVKEKRREKNRYRGNETERDGNKYDKNNWRRSR